MTGQTRGGWRPPSLGPAPRRADGQDPAPRRRFVSGHVPALDSEQRAVCWAGVCCWEPLCCKELVSCSGAAFQGAVALALALEESE